MHILSVKKNLFVLCSLLNDWNYFGNKFCNLPFLAICRSLLPPLLFPVSSWYQKAKIGLRMNLRKKQTKKIIILKDFIKQTVINRFLVQFFSAFLFSLTAAYAFANLEKLIRFHWKAWSLARKFQSADIYILPKTYSF